VNLVTSHFTVGIAGWSILRYLDFRSLPMDHGRQQIF
jgi:hypothetical protein